MSKVALLRKIAVGLTRDFGSVLGSIDRACRRGIELYCRAYYLWSPLYVVLELCSLDRARMLLSGNIQVVSVVHDAKFDSF